MGTDAIGEIAFDTVPEAITILLGITIVALAVGVWKTARRDFALKD